ncbi:DUF2784 domain-containing protein [Saccharicrinis sp. 156]|uniref:DUF2784 domain-containing protein n=2 Tax=unclassified Saccharicrinis TaxID=2646859 RepID=UPI003D3351A0
MIENINGAVSSDFAPFFLPNRNFGHTFVWMVYKVLADIIFMLHLFFIVFVVLGGILVLRWEKLVWVHIPLALWGVIVEWGNFICPLTPLENKLRELGGGTGFELSFTEQYLYPIVYIDNLNREVQLVLGLIVLFINFVVYSMVFLRKKNHEKR